MAKLDYNKTQSYWNEGFKKKQLGQYSSGYIVPAQFEEVAHYRFKKELEFLNKFGKFGGKYLDIGCGTGNFICAWHERFDSLVGVDFSKPLVQIAEERCKSLKNVKIFEDDALNFEKYLEKDDIFRFIFIGGCLMYLNDEDVPNLLFKLFQKLDNGGVLIFRESIATEERICEDNKNYTTIRRTIDEYKKLIRLDENSYTLKYYQNHSVNYTYLISLYIRIFPFLKNKISFFNNFLIEFFFLYLPKKIYAKLKRNSALNYFFIINKK
jgi:SAM-dependent methyltransferase